MELNIPGERIHKKYVDTTLRIGSQKMLGSCWPDVCLYRPKSPGFFFFGYTCRRGVLFKIPLKKFEHKIPKKVPNAGIKE